MGTLTHLTPFHWLSAEPSGGNLPAPGFSLGRGSVGACVQFSGLSGVCPKDSFPPLLLWSADAPSDTERELGEQDTTILKTTVELTETDTA